MKKNFIEHSKSLIWVEQLKSMDLYPFFKSIDNSEGTMVSIAGKKQIMIGSNNYLGLTHHPYVIEATIKAIKKYGTGCTGSRLLNGNLSIHGELEERLAKYLGHEKALVFSTGMQANLGTLAALCGPRNCMLFDSENHASMIDSSRVAMGTTFKYKHNNMESLEEQLSLNINRFKKVMIVTDGVFSMTGDVAKLPEIINLAKKYNAYVYVDDAHGIGVLGDRGKGTMNHFNVTDDVDFNMGTFSKSFASIGGVVSASKESINYIKHHARSFIFSAAMPPSAVATVSACLDLIENEPSFHENLWKNVKFMRDGFKSMNFYTYNSQTPILPIFIGDDMKSMKVAKFLAENGIFATPVVSPAVSTGEAIIRTSYMSTHKRSQLEQVLDLFKKAKKKFNIPSYSGE